MSKAIDLSKYLGKARNRISFIGIELEGGWTKLPPNTKIQHDGSVAFPKARPIVDPITGITTGWNGPQHIGELPSPPWKIHEWQKWIEQHYPSHVNDTCGLHVHMSFNALSHYEKLMQEPFMWTVVAELGKWAKKAKIPLSHPLWKRLRGENQYCQLKHFADQQVMKQSKAYTREGDGHRYTAINYCYSLHGTVECRILPMFDKTEQAIGAIETILSTTNAFLLYSAKEKKVSITAPLLESNLSEEFEVCVS